MPSPADGLPPGGPSSRPVGAGGLPRPLSEAGQAGLAALLQAPRRALIALDYDGTLAPIVSDPLAARPHPGAVAALRRLAPLAGAPAPVTGRAAPRTGHPRRPG